MHASQNSPTNSTLGRADVVEAARRLTGQIVRTPTIRANLLEAEAGCELYLKAENLQHIGAFKARGALHAIGRLSAEARAKGVITYSSGNHAQAVAMAARRFNIAATIAMPEDAPAVKVAGVRREGATIVIAGTTSDDRKTRAHQIAAETGATIIQPFDDDHVIAGQGTATLELLEDTRALGVTLDALLIPTGGGGVLAGACLAASDEEFPIFSIEPHGCDAMRRSLEQGKRVAVKPGPTLGDGLKPVMVGERNFAIARQRAAGGILVDDEDMGHALIGLLLRHKLLVEPSGAAGLAVALRKKIPGAPRRVGVILTGGNVDTTVVTTLLAKHAKHWSTA